MPGVALALDDRPATLAAAGGNPLGLSATAFLEWYWAVLLVLIGATAVVRLLGGRMRAPARPAAEPLEDPYLMAYLAGGPQRVLDAVMASLVEQGALRVNAVTRELIAEQGVPEDRPKLERRTRSLLSGAQRVQSAADFRRRLQRGLQPSLSLMRQRLLQAGLLDRPGLQVRARLPLRVGFALLLGVGAVRLVGGVEAGRPVGFLVVSMVLTGLFAWWLLRGLGAERPTARGQRVLDHRRSQLGQGDDDRLWTVALLGLAGYGMGPMVDLHHVMQVSNGSLFGGGQKGKSGDSSGGGSCGASGCGGGGCGGGGCGG